MIPITIINALKNKSFNCSNGQQLRDFTYIDDIISAIIKTLKNLKSSGEIINIGSGKPIAIKKVIIKICRLLNSGKPLFGKIDLRRDEMMKLYTNINKAKTILRWTSRTPLEVGLRKTIKFFSK